MATKASGTLLLIIEKQHASWDLMCSNLHALEIRSLINNAGAGIPKGPLHEQSSKAFRDLLELNVVSLLSVSSAVLRHAMLAQGRGHIISMAT